jgi:hypothetical protein
MLAAGAAHAEVFTSLAEKDCDKGSVSNEVLRDRALAEAKVPLTNAVATALVQGRLGAMAEKALACGMNCKGTDATLNTLYFQLQGLTENLPRAADGFSIHIDDRRAPALEARAAAFLNGNWDWLRVTCSFSPEAAEGGRPPGRAPNPPNGGGGIDVLLGKSEEDVGKSFDKRGFATLGYSNDFEAGKESWTLDAYLALRGPALGEDRDLEFQPFTSFQYNSGKKVDDLAFGGALIWRPTGGGDRIRLTGAWETDHRFDASLWRGDIGFSPVAPAKLCQRRNELDTRYFLCEVTLLGDFERVSAAGGKADLAKLTDFFRIGGDAHFTYGELLSPKLGYVVFTTGFSLRENLSAGDADATLFSASLGLTPAKTGAWKFSFDYTRGRDLTSLVKEDKLVLSIGFRQ